MIEGKLRPLGVGLSFSPPKDKQPIIQQVSFEGLGEKTGRGGRKCTNLKIIQEQDTATSMSSEGTVPATEEGANQGLRVRQRLCIQKVEETWLARLSGRVSTLEP